MDDKVKGKAKLVVKEEQSVYHDRPERFEMIGGVRYDFLSSPKYVHQKISANFYITMHNTCHLNGEVLYAPMDVYFDDEDNVAQPDIIFIANENRHIIRDGYIYGAPDLLVEILSQSTGRKDKTIKKAMFEQFGVKEYWIIEPEYRTVDQFILMDGKYQLIATLADDQWLTSPHFACISIDLSKVFPSEEPNRT